MDKHFSSYFLAQIDYRDHEVESGLSLNLTGSTHELS